MPARTNGAGPHALSHLAFWRPALRVLCYHGVHPSGRDRLTVSTEQFERHLEYLVTSEFTFIQARDLISGLPLPSRPLLLSFDDGYVDVAEYALPLLRRYGAKATLFAVTGDAGSRPQWSAGGTLMGPDQLRALDARVIEIALHSHSHRRFETMSSPDIEIDVRRNMDFLREHGIAFTPALAYPYGSRPPRAMPDLRRRLASLGIRLAFRVGNRLNRLPLRDPYEIQRIDVRGDRGNLTFKKKLWMGKLV